MIKLLHVAGKKPHFQLKMNLYQLMLVGAGGFLGSVLRYITSKAIDAKMYSVFPYGTLLVNVAGSFILGMIYVIALKRSGDSENIRLFLGAGFCGGFTTFSAFALENFRLMEQRLIGTSVLYIGTSLVLGLLGLWAGITLIKNLS